jgi:hypothetical protein
VETIIQEIKNFKNLKPSQTETLEELTIKKLNLKTSRTYHIKLNFQELFNQPAEDAEAYLKKWYLWATHSRLEPIKEVAYTIKRHWDGVLRWFQPNVNYGILERINHAYPVPSQNGGLEITIFAPHPCREAQSELQTWSCRDDSGHIRAFIDVSHPIARYRQHHGVGMVFWEATG